MIHRDAHSCCDSCAGTQLGACLVDVFFIGDVLALLVLV